MMLSAEDIERLKRKGYAEDFFARLDTAGYVTLRNVRGHCVFYDAEKGRCMVYAARPSGCRVYPVVFDEEKGVVADIAVCRAWSSVTEPEKARKGKKVVELLARIDAEAERRSYS